MRAEDNAPAGNNDKAQKLSDELLLLSTEPSASSGQVGEPYDVDPYYTKTWRSNIWPNLDYPKQQRKTLFKLDFCVLFCAMFSTFIKYLDKSNLSAAYVSGMQEALEIHGNELSYANTAYSTVAVVSGVAGGYLMVRFNTKWFIIGVEATWTLLTFCFAFIKSPTQMIALRAMIGIEGCHFAILMFYVGSYYKQTETSRRCNIINAFTAIGPMCGFALQARCVTSLDGVNGFQAWQWLYFIDTIFSVACILVQVLFLPNILEKAKPNWMFSEEELTFLRQRLPPRNVDADAQKPGATWSEVKSFVMNWKVYFIWSCSVLSGFAQDSSAAVPFFFKGWNTIKPGTYTTEQINILTIPAYIVQLLTCIINSYIAEIFFAGSKWQTIVIGVSWSTVVSFFLATHKIFEEPKGTMMFFFYTTTICQGVSGQFWAEAQDLFAGNTKLRSFVSGGINPATDIRIAIFNPILWPSSKLPETYAGYYTAGVSCVLYVLMVGTYGFYNTMKARKPPKTSNMSITP